MNRDAFEMDGTVHYRDEDCDCRPTPCKRCTAGWEHYQAMYGGYARECDACGFPDVNEPRHSISPERVAQLDAPYIPRPGDFDWIGEHPDYLEQKRRILEELQETPVPWWCECDWPKWADMEDCGGTIVHLECGLPVACSESLTDDCDEPPHAANTKHIDYVVCWAHEGIAINNVADRRI